MSLMPRLKYHRDPQSPEMGQWAEQSSTGSRSATIAIIMKVGTLTHSSVILKQDLGFFSIEIICICYKENILLEKLFLFSTNIYLMS